MVQYIVEYLAKCPALSGRLPAADFLGKEEGCVGVFALGVHPVVVQYVDGGCIKQFAFRVSFREKSYGPEQETVSSLCKQVENWIRRETDLPDIGKDGTAVRMEVTKTGAVAERSYGSQRYDMECRLLYYSQKGE